MKKRVGSLPTEAIASVGIKIVASLAAFLFSVLLARLLGKEEFGVYTQVFVVASALALIAQFGVPNVLIREIAANRAVRNDAAVNSVVWWGALTWFASFLFILIGFYAILALVELREPFRGLAWFVLVIVFVISASAVRDGVMRGFDRVLLTQLPDRIFRPAFSAAIAVTMFSLFGATGGVALVAVSLGIGLSALIGFVFMFRTVPNKALRFSSSWFARKDLYYSAFLLALSTGLNQVNNYADIIILGFFREPGSIGVYRAMYQFSLLALFFQQALAAIYTQKFSLLFALSEMEELQRIAKSMARASVALALVFFLGLVFFGKEIIGLVYGDHYLEGYVALLLLVAGQLVSAFFAPVGYVLNMCGREFLMSRILLFSALLNIGVNLLVIPVYGIVGAGAATFLSLLVWNVFAWRGARAYLGVDCSAI